MNCSNSLIRPTLKLSVVGIVALTAAFSSFASDSDRIAQLEKEVLELKLRQPTLRHLKKNLASIKEWPHPMTAGNRWLTGVLLRRE